MATMRFGTAMRDITPVRPVVLHGYAHRVARSNGVSEPLRLSALALDDGTTKALVITLDTIGLHTTEAAELAAVVESATGVPAGNVLVCASHTHFAPAVSTAWFSSHEVGFFEPEETDRDRIFGAATGAAKEAVDSLVPCRVESTRVDVAGVSFNRRTARPDGSVETSFRYPNEGSWAFGEVDPQLTAIRFVTEAGSGAVLANFGCHPVTGGYDNEADSCRVSSDYVHYLRRAVEDAWGYPLHFTLGAAGDAVPRDRNGESRRRIGTVLGESLVLANRMFAPVEGGLSVERLSMEAQTILAFDPDESRARYDAELQKSREAGETSEGFADALFARFRSSLYPQNRLEVPVTLLRIGPITLVALPFEVLSEFATRMKSRAPDSVLVSCAGGYQGYLPFAFEYDRGGYEATDRSTHLAPGTADALFDLVERHLR